MIAIVLTAPIGAILINTLGIRWLSYDGIDGKTETHQDSDGNMIEFRQSNVQSTIDQPSRIQPEEVK